MRFDQWLTFAAVRFFYFIFEILPMRMASGLGGWLGRTVGPLFPVSNTARKNLRRVLPERAADHEKIVRGMWDNFGRVFAEYPHLRTIAKSEGGAKIEVLGGENMRAMQGMGRGGIFIGAHLANWECGPNLAADWGAPVHIVYRPPNNPWVDRLLTKARRSALSSIVKGAGGAREILRVLKNKEFIVMLVDQKMNDGISVLFMGVPAMTVAAPVQLAMKLQVPICLIRCERIEGMHFRWTVLPPFIPPKDGDEVQIMTEINAQIGEWIRARPEQWLWVHNRWGKE